MNTQQTVAEIPFKKVNATPMSGVTITKVRLTGRDGQTYQVELRQTFVNQVTTQSALLNITMAGHSAFSSPVRTRVAWQSFSKEQLSKLNLPHTAEQIDGKGAEGMSYLASPLPFTLILNGKVTPCKLVETDTLVGRTWLDAQGNPKSQAPKSAGVGGDIITYNGQPIYRNIALAIEGMDFEDSIIPHNNVVVGSTVRARAAEATTGAVASNTTTAAATVGTPVITGQQAAQNASQNAGQQQQQKQTNQPAKTTT